MEPEGPTAPHLLIKPGMAIGNSTPLMTESPLSEIPPMGLSGSELGTAPLNVSNLTSDSGAVNNRNDGSTPQPAPNNTLIMLFNQASLAQLIRSLQTTSIQQEEEPKGLRLTDPAI
jgi:hypothetical protein